jgi:hypothetical protein
VEDQSLEQQIADARSQVQDLQGLMARTDDRFRQAALDWMGGWYRDEAERAVVHENPERSLAAGQAAISALRKEVEQWTARLPEMSPTHQLTLSGGDDALKYSFRELAGGLGYVLNQHGFVSILQQAGASEDHDWAYMSWPSPGLPVYNRDVLPWRQDMEALRQEYKDLDEQLVAAEARLAGLQRQKAEQDAQQLWDRAEGQSE